MPCRWTYPIDDIAAIGAGGRPTSLPRSDRQDCQRKPSPGQRSIGANKRYRHRLATGPATVRPEAALQRGHWPFRAHRRSPSSGLQLPCVRQTGCLPIFRKQPMPPVARRRRDATVVIEVQSRFQSAAVDRRCSSCGWRIATNRDLRHDPIFADLMPPAKQPVSVLPERPQRLSILPARRPPADWRVAIRFGCLAMPRILSSICRAIRTIDRKVDSIANRVLQ